ncbi:DNA adenine methylase [Brevibacillus choshinensis]|uniref:DNA adenine methylase n=1 Tax=Brevibacillus choshinensis TaxID=54911 RepID=UPI00399CE552
MASFAGKNKLNKQLSPLRYPGGKSKIASYLCQKLHTGNTKNLVSPYAGGASVELALLHADLIQHLVINDYDFGVYALFDTIKRNPEYLLRKIADHIPTHEDYFRAREKVVSGYKDCDILDAAWSMLVNNRLAYSGIYRANPLGGRNGAKDQLLSRWKPAALMNRITTIHTMRDRFEVLNIDACELIEEAYWKPHTTLLIGPPYYKQGKVLYRCFYEEREHINLNTLLESLYSGFPGADILLCYDDEQFIENLYWFPQVEKINRAFSA